MSTFISGFDESLVFPDRQPHVKLIKTPSGTSRYRLQCRIVSGDDLVKVGMAVDVLRHRGWNFIDLEIAYLMGSRMDRRLSDLEPYSLRVICRFINSLKVDSVAVFVPHSQATSDLLDNYIEFPDQEEQNFYEMGIQQCLAYFAPNGGDGYWAHSNNLSLVFPDAGATKRFAKSGLLETFPNAEIVTLYKDREERTGKIHGMKLLSGEIKQFCVIVDDLCDGGATFKSAANLLLANRIGDTSIGLVVAHGVFSKGIPIEGIDFIATTNSFASLTSDRGLHVYQL